MKLITFGYGGDATPEARLFPGLAQYDCKVLFDVRESPKSPNRAQWNQRNLRDACEVHAVQYYHEFRLGNVAVDGKRRLPWCKPEAWRYGVRLLVGTLFNVGTAAIMCCEGEPFITPTSKLDIRLAHNCHRVEVAHIALAYVQHFLLEETLEIVHLRPKQNPIVYSNINDAECYNLVWSEETSAEGKEQCNAKH